LAAVTGVNPPIRCAPFRSVFVRNSESLRWCPLLAVTGPRATNRRPLRWAIVQPEPALGCTDTLDSAWSSLGAPGQPARVARVDRGWSTVWRAPADAAPDAAPQRLRNHLVRGQGADVAVGDWVVGDDADEAITHVLP